MTTRTPTTVTRPEPQPGTGILHPFPTTELPALDPFVFLDTGAPRNPGDGEIYVGPHPHRGVQPVSLLFRGRIEHRDSLGNDRTVDSGGIQWLMAGSGALHEEVLGGDDTGVFHMAQLWINLPAELKGSPPEHHALTPDAVPEVIGLGDGSLLRVYAGEVDGSTGPAPTPSPVLIAHLALEPGGSADIPARADWTAATTVVAGDAAAGGTSDLGPGATTVFDSDGDRIVVTSTAGGEVLVMCGQPLGEPVAMGGGFVMNTSEEIAAAFEDHAAGRMGELDPSR